MKGKSAAAKRGRNGRARTPPVKSKKKGLHGLHHGGKKGQHPVSPLAKDGGGASGSNKRKCFQEACYAIENSNMDEEEEFFTDGKFGMNGFGSSKKSGLANKEVQCSKKGCCKRFSGVNALRFHLSYAHNELKARHEAEKARKRKAKEAREREEEGKRLRLQAEQKRNEELQQRLIHGKVDAHFGRSLEGLVAPQGLNLVKTPTASPSSSSLQAQQQVSPGGRATAVVKPLQQQYPNGALYKPPVQNGNPSQSATAATAASSRRPASPAYSDISDEETDGVKPIALVGSTKGPPPTGSPAKHVAKPGPGISVRPEFKDQQSIATAAVKPTSQSVGPPQPGSIPPPPGMLAGHPGLSLPGLLPGMPPGASAPGAAAGNPLLGNQGAAAAAAAAALAAADQQQLMAFMDLMHQQATASQYLSATSKLQELQERALGGGHFRPAAAPLSISSSQRLPPGLPPPHSANRGGGGGGPSSSLSGTTLSSSGLPSTMISPSISSSAAAAHRQPQPPAGQQQQHQQLLQHHLAAAAAAAAATSSNPSSSRPPPQSAPPAHQSSLPAGFSLAMPPTVASSAPPPGLFGPPTTSFPGKPS